MQKLGFLICAMCSFGSTFFASASPERTSLDITNALQVIADTGSSSNAFSDAIAILDGVRIDKNFWLRVARDQQRDPDRRRQCVKCLFGNIDTRHLTLRDLVMSLNAPVNWISIKRVEKSPAALMGPLPNGLITEKTRSLFFIPILPEAKGAYRLGIYMSLEGDPSENDLRQAFSTGKMDDAVGNIHVTAFAKFDTVDVEEKHPGQSSHLITW